MFKVHLPITYKKASLVAIAFMMLQLPVGIVGGSSVLAIPNENANVQAHEQAAQKQANPNQSQHRHDSAIEATNLANEGQVKKDEATGRNASADSTVNSVNGQRVDSTVQEHKISICHATHSATNPFVSITIARSAAYHAHIAHQDGEDIIPPFDYDGQTYSQNWDTTGQVTYHNGCKTGGSILGETVSGSRGGGNSVQAGNVATGQLSNTGTNITLPLFAAATLIALTCGLAIPAVKFHQA